MHAVREKSFSFATILASLLITAPNCADVGSDDKPLNVSGKIIESADSVAIPIRSQLAVYFHVRGERMESDYWYKWGGANVSGETWSLTIEVPPDEALSMGGKLGQAFLVLHPEKYEVLSDGRLDLGQNIDAFSNVIGFGPTDGIVYVAPDRELNPYRTWPDGFSAGLSCSQAPSATSPDSDLKPNECNDMKIALGSGEAPKWVELE